MGSNGEVVPVAELRAAQARIKELERLIGKKEAELEILRAARDEVKKGSAGTACRNPNAATGHDDVPDASHWTGDRVPRPEGSTAPVSSAGGSARRRPAANTFAPHPSLGMRTTAEFRREHALT